MSLLKVTSAARIQRDGSSAPGLYSSLPVPNLSLQFWFSQVKMSEFLDFRYGTIGDKFWINLDKYSLWGLHYRLIFCTAQAQWSTQNAASAVPEVQNPPVLSGLFLFDSFSRFGQVCIHTYIFPLKKGWCKFYSRARKSLRGICRREVKKRDKTFHFWHW